MSRYILDEPVRLMEIMSVVAPFAQSVTGTTPLDARVRALLTLDEMAGDASAIDVQAALDSWPEAVELCDANTPLVVLSRPEDSLADSAWDRNGGSPRIAITLLKDAPWPLIHDAIATLAQACGDEVDLTGVRVLTDVVDHVGEALNGSIIVEDHAFQMLAYSRGVGELDEARRVAILERRLPDVYQRAFNAQGIIAKLVGGQDIVYAEAVPSIGLGPRLVVAIRHDGDLLGSLWLARDSSPFVLGDEQILRRTAAHLGSVLRKMRSVKNAQERHLHETLVRLLDQAHAQDASNELSRVTELPTATHLHVLRFFVPSTRPSSSSSWLQSIRTAAEAVGRSTRIRNFALVDEDCTKVIVLGCSEKSGSSQHEHPLQFARTVLAQAGASGKEVSVAIGEHQPGFDRAWRSDVDAANTFRGMLTHYKPMQIARSRDVWAECSVDGLLSSARDSLTSQMDTLNAMVACDGERHTDYVATLSAILDSWGDVRTAAQGLHIHPNTLRYRVTRMSESFDLDLDNPKQRVAIQLQLLILAGQWTDLPTDRSSTDLAIPRPHLL